MFVNLNNKYYLLTMTYEMTYEKNNFFRVKIRYECMTVVNFY